MIEFYAELLKHRNEYKKTFMYEKRQLAKAVRNLEKAIIKELKNYKVLKFIWKFINWLNKR